MTGLAEDLAKTICDPRYMSDDEIKRLTRECLIQAGHPEAATCTLRELGELSKNYLREIGDPWMKEMDARTRNPSGKEGAPV